MVSGELWTIDDEYAALLDLTDNSRSLIGYFREGSNYRNISADDAAYDGNMLALSPGGGALYIVDPNTLSVERKFFSDRETFGLAYIPEPSTLTLLAMGALGLLAYRRRR